MTEIEPPRAAYPTRLIARAMGQFLIHSARAWARPHGGDLMSAFVFCTMLSANLDHIGYGDAEAALRPRPISANAIAQSLSLPYETVRRRVTAMIADGRCRRESGGLVVSDAMLTAPAHVAAVDEVRRLLDGVVRLLIELGLDFEVIAAMAGVAPAATVLGPPPDALVARIVLDGQIRSLETAVPIFGDILCAYVCTAIIAANVRPMLVNPVLAWRYASDNASPPDELRQPVRIRELARELEMPFETVRRQVARLIDHGAVIVVPGRGVMVPGAATVGEQAINNHAKLMIEFVRMIGNLARAGYRFGN